MVAHVSASACVVALVALLARLVQWRLQQCMEAMRRSVSAESYRCSSCCCLLSQHMTCQWTVAHDCCTNHNGSSSASHLLVDLCAMVEAVLTSARHAPLQAGRVPRSHARHLAQTTMSLAGQAGHTPAGHHTLGTATLQVNTQMSRVMRHTSTTQVRKGLHIFTPTTAVEACDVFCCVAP
jgi:hypothetical protein